MKTSDWLLDNPTWQTEWKTAPLIKVQLCEYENQTLEAFVAASRLSAKFDCPVTRQKFSLLATAYDCEIGYLDQFIYSPHIRSYTFCYFLWEEQLVGQKLHVNDCDQFIYSPLYSAQFFSSGVEGKIRADQCSVKLRTV